MKQGTTGKKTVYSCHPWFSLPSASHVQLAPKLIHCIILCLESIPDPMSLRGGGQVLSSFLDLAIGLLPDLAGFAVSLFQSVLLQDVVPKGTALASRHHNTSLQMLTGLPCGRKGRLPLLNGDKSRVHGRQSSATYK